MTDPERIAALEDNLRKCHATHVAEVNMQIKLREKREQQLAAANARIMKYENDEASVCPEDVGFVELIGVLQKKLDAANMLIAGMRIELLTLSSAQRPQK